MQILPFCVALDGTGESICEKSSILLLCTLTAMHKVVALGIAIAKMENKFAIHYFCKAMKKVEQLFPGFKWLLAIFVSDGVI